MGPAGRAFIEQFSENKAHWSEIVNDFSLIDKLLEQQGSLQQQWQQ